jgi:hypothetical protein
MTISRITADLRLPDWSIYDPVLHLREFGTERIYKLPPPPRSPYQELFIGTDPSCAIRLEDPAVSRKHARLMYEDLQWGLLDVGSRNGTQIDGHRAAVGFMGSGAEIKIGSTTLIAESRRLVVLRALLCRLLGWASERATAVDLALRMVRVAQLQRTPLFLRGTGDLVPLARDLHRHLFDLEAPFVHSSPRRASAVENLRLADALEQELTALRLARRGTLCICTQHLPGDYLKLSELLRDPRVTAQLIVCAETPSAESLIDTPITIPDPAHRGDELPRVIAEYCEDAAASFPNHRADLATPRDWILRHAAQTIPDIATGAYRLAALRACGSVDDAAAALGLEPTTLREWIELKRPPAPT